jgi:site-specific DNA-cytosine methylase
VIGPTFAAWVERLEGLGYRVGWRVLAAHDHGVPTLRRRLFVVARLDGRPPAWPEPTHGPGLEPYRTVGGCLDRSIPPALPARVLSPTVMAKIRRGAERWPEFLIVYRTSTPPKPLDAPAPTLTTRSSVALATCRDRELVGYRMLTPDECKRVQGFPDNYRLGAAPSQRARLAVVGNGVCPPVAEALARTNLDAMG